MASGASWILGTSPGGNAPPEVIAAASKTSIPLIEYYALLRAGWTAQLVPVLKLPGYTAPPARVIETPSGPAISVLSQIQRYTESYADTFESQSWSDALVSERLTGQAHAAAAWLFGEDPDVNNIDALVAEYVKVFRAAVTPAAVTP